MSFDAIRTEEALWREYLKEKKEAEKKAQAEIKAFLTEDTTTPDVSSLESAPKDKKRSERRRQKRKEKKRVQNVAAVVAASQGSRTELNDSSATFRDKEGRKSPRKKRRFPTEILKKAEKLANGEA